MSYFVTHSLFLLLPPNLRFITLVQLLLKYLSRLQFTTVHSLRQQSVSSISSLVQMHFLCYLKRNQIMGGLGQDEKTRRGFFPSSRLTNGNILILAFIPQDWEHNFMITSLLEPCLIIPNYAARHLLHSVSPTMQPEQHLACCSVCVQSPWYHRWACSPILAGYSAETYAVVLIIQHGIFQEGVYSVSLAPAFFLQFVTQFTQTCSVEHLRPGMWWMHRRTGTTCTYCARKTHSQHKERKTPWKQSVF